MRSRFARGRSRRARASQGVVALTAVLLLATACDTLSPVIGGYGAGDPDTIAQRFDTVSVGPSGQVVVLDRTAATIRQLSPSLTDEQPVAGGGPRSRAVPPDGTPAVGSGISPYGLSAADGAGNVLFTVDNDVLTVPTTSGTYYGRDMHAGDLYAVVDSSTPGPATAAASLSGPQDVVVDAFGNVLIDDRGNDRVCLFAVRTGTFYGQSVEAGKVYTVAGKLQGVGGDGVPATEAEVSSPADIALDHNGNLVMSSGGQQIRVVAASDGSFYGRAMVTGRIYTVAGDYDGSAADGVPATGAHIVPNSVTGDSYGNVLLSETESGTYQLRNVRVIAGETGVFYGQAMTAGDIYTVAGNSSTSDFDNPQSGALATQTSLEPVAVAGDHEGNVVIGDNNGNLYVLAGSTGTSYGMPVTVGHLYSLVTGSGQPEEGQPAGGAQLVNPRWIAGDSRGDIALNVDGGAVRLVPGSSGTDFGQSMTQGHIYTILDASAGGYQPPADGVNARSTLLNPGDKLALDSDGDLVVANGFEVLLVPSRDKVLYGRAMTTGTLYRIAGGGSANGDGVPATTARIGRLESLGVYGGGDVAVDPAGDLIINDFHDYVVRVVPAQTGVHFGRPMVAGDIYTLLGTGAEGYSGDGGPGNAASAFPIAAAIDSRGDVAVSDLADTVRFIPMTSGTYFGQTMVGGDVYRVAGQVGSASSSGYGVPGPTATFTPGPLVFDDHDNLAALDLTTSVVHLLAASDGTFYDEKMSIGDLYAVAGTYPEAPLVSVAAGGTPGTLYVLDPARVYALVQPAAGAGRASRVSRR